MDEPKELALKDIVNRYPKNTLILEVGFGDAEFLKALAKKGFHNLIATETSEICIVNARKKVNIVKYFLTNDPLILQIQQPLITCCFEVIEHLQDPKSFLQKLPGSTLYLSTPNRSRWYVRLFRKFEKWDFPPNHLHRFNVTDLHSLLAQASWSPEILESTIVKPHEILRSIFSRSVESNNYDVARPKRRWLTSNARRALIPVTWCTTVLLNWKGYRGVSFYVKAVR